MQRYLVSTRSHSQNGNDMNPDTLVLHCLITVSLTNSLPPLIYLTRIRYAHLRRCGSCKTTSRFGEWAQRPCLTAEYVFFLLYRLFWLFASCRPKCRCSNFYKRTVPQRWNERIFQQAASKTWVSLVLPGSDLTFFCSWSSCSHDDVRFTDAYYGILNMLLV